MLQIPELIQALFKQDGVRKNFRVTFPNGEYPDLINTSIVMESLRYTESLCSQDVFKFGLAEGSSIEFETVGVGNMYGMEIRCRIEIDCSSYDAYQLTPVVVNPGDGVLVLGAPDTGWRYYAIDLGRYRVTSCPRNQGAMTHRRVHADTLWPAALKQLSAYDKFKLNAQYLAHSSKPALQMNLSNFVFAATGIGKYSTRPQEEYLRVTDSPSSSYSTQHAFQYISGSGSSAVTNVAVFELTHNVFQLQEDGVYSTNEFSAWSPAATLYSDIQAWASGNGYRLVVPQGYSSFEAFLQETCAHQICYAYENPASVASLPMQPITVDDQLFYPNGLARTPAVVYTESAAFSPFTVTRPSTIFPTVSIWRPETAGPLDGVTVSFEPTLKTKISGKTYVSYSDTLSALDLIQGYYELQAQFLRPISRARTGGNIRQVVSLDASAPAAIGPSEMEELWWDEYDVEPIGTVLYSYTDSDGNENAANYTFGTGTSVYDMRDNAVLKAVPGATQASIQALLEAAFIPNVQAAAFTPAELDMPAWPWLEAGDALQLTAEDGTVVNSFCLVREMSGIQKLFDSITATGGELIEEDET